MRLALTVIPSRAGNPRPPPYPHPANVAGRPSFGINHCSSQISEISVGLCLTLDLGCECGCALRSWVASLRMLCVPPAPSGMPKVKLARPHPTRTPPRFAEWVPPAGMHWDLLKRSPSNCYLAKKMRPKCHFKCNIHVYL